MNYKKQTNPEVKLGKKQKFEYFNKFNPNKQAKIFWGNRMPYFSHKHMKTDTKMMLPEYGYRQNRIIH